MGDLLQYELDLTVQNFSGTGSIGVHLDNNYYWTEQLFGRIYAQYCTSHVVFDWTSSASTTSSGSFERCDLDIYIDQVEREVRRGGVPERGLRHQRLAEDPRQLRRRAARR